MSFLTRPDLRTNYQTLGPPLHGGQSPVALIHGLGANLAFWYLGAAPHMAQDRSLVMHDLRGHGASSMPDTGYGLTQLAEDFRTLLDDLDIDRAHVVGHSHGARVALAFAIRHPDRVTSLTLADTQLRALQDPMRLADWPHWPRWKSDLARQGVTCFPSDEAEIDFRVLAALGPRGRGTMAQPVSPGAEIRQVRPANSPAGHQMGARLRAARQAALTAPQDAMEPQDLTPDTLATRLPVRGIDLRSRQVGARSSQKWQTLLEDTTAGTELSDESAITEDDLSALGMPTLLMYGALSHCVPTSDRLLDVLPDARRILVPEAGHFFPLVKPRPFARALRMFVAGVESADRPARQRLISRVMAARGGRMRQDGGA